MNRNLLIYLLGVATGWAFSNKNKIKDFLEKNKIKEKAADTIKNANDQIDKIINDESSIINKAKEKIFKKKEK